MANGTLAASQIEMLSQSGTGIITITPPATNTNRAITLPDAAGAIVVSGTTPSLNGITFPATQVPSADANTLDDYEEGTWTPIASSGGGSITSYTSSGIYTKVGRMVYVIGQIALTTVGTASGRLILSSLPFITANTTARPAVGVVREDSATGVMYYSYLTTNNTTGTIATTSDGSIVWTNGYSYSFCFVYQTT